MSDWSNLADEARAQSRKPGPKCQVKGLLESLPAEQAEQVRVALADGNVGNTGLARALKIRLGAEAAPSIFSIGNHRRGNCRCTS